MIYTIDGTHYTINETNGIYTSPVLREFINIIKKNDNKYTIDYGNTFNVPNKSFTTLQAAFREALLTQKKYL